MSRIFQLKIDPSIYAWAYDSPNDTVYGRVGSQPSTPFNAPDDWTLLPYTSADELEASRAVPVKPNKFAEKKYNALIAAGFSPDNAKSLTGWV